MTDEEIRGYLRQLRDESPPADSLARVRARVEDRIAVEGRGWFRWQWTVAVVASMVLVAVIWLRRPAVEKLVVIPPVPRPVVAEIMPGPPEAAAVRKVVKRRVQKRAPAKESNVMRIQTEDPDVLLVFITDGGEE